MLYLAYYDDNPKHGIAQKIAAAIAAYQARLGTLPTVALVNEADNAPANVAGVAVRAVGRNNVMVGVEA